MISGMYFSVNYSSCNIVMNILVYEFYVTTIARECANARYIEYNIIYSWMHLSDIQSIRQLPA